MKKQSFFINANLESKHFSTQSLCTSSLQYVIHLLHIIFKFTIHSWQVPRSSVGRALYRECGPSQDRNPVPGDLPFCFLLLFFFSFFFLRIFFWSLVAIPMLYRAKRIVWSIFVYSSSRLTTLAKVFFHLFASLSF